MATGLACPKCRGAMRNYERNSIQIDQCTECRGVFLDRGELEQLMDAEAAYTQAAERGRVAPIPGPPQQGNQAPANGREQGRHHGKTEYGGYQSRRKKGFLGELFD